jgi:heparan-alpha-glucosaminide N-acetyltransferase
VVRRSATLAAIGLFLDAPATLGRWRFPGVLQYFGFSYLWCAGTVVLTGSWDGEAGQQAQAALEAQQLNSAAPGGGEGFPYDTFLDLRFFWREWVGIGVAPLMWLMLTFGVHVPGCGYGYLGPGGRSLSGSGGGGGDDDDDSFAACTGGSHRYIDMQFFGSKHLYDEPTCSVAYECNTPYDPEGLVGGFNAVLLTYLGLVAGRALIYHSSSKARMARLGVQGLLWLTIGAALCGFSQHGGAIPVNKNLWSLSFVLVTAGFGCWVLAVLYWIVDHAKLWSGAPFKYTGMNSIVVYAGSEILEMYFPFHVSVCFFFCCFLTLCIFVFFVFFKILFLMYVILSFASLWGFLLVHIV